MAEVLLSAYPTKFSPGGFEVEKQMHVVQPSSRPEGGRAVFEAGGFGAEMWARRASPPAGGKRSRKELGDTK